MASTLQASLDAVPYRVAHPEFIPVKRYYDAEFYELEKARLWSRVWQLACRLEEIPEIGDFTEYTIFEKTVLIIHTKAGIKAFHNVCRHRGMKLLDGHGNCRKQGIVCGFHGWRYDIEGRNTFVFGREVFSEEALQNADLNLKPCRVETWAGCAFVNFDDEAPSLIESFGPHTRALERATPIGCGPNGGAPRSCR